MHMRVPRPSLPELQLASRRPAAGEPDRKPPPYGEEPSPKKILLDLADSILTKSEDAQSGGTKVLVLRLES